jgi:hypothetical protein
VVALDDLFDVVVGWQIFVVAAWHGFGGGSADRREIYCFAVVVVVLVAEASTVVVVGGVDGEGLVASTAPVVVDPPDSSPCLHRDDLDWVTSIEAVGVFVWRPWIVVVVGWVRALA